MSRGTLKRIICAVIGSVLMLSLLAAPAMAEGNLIGYVEGDTYRNDFFGFQYDLPEGYEFADIPELAELSGVERSFYDNNEEDVTASWFDLYVEDAGTGSNLNAVPAAFNAEEYAKLQTMTMEELLEEFLPALEEQYTNLGLETYAAYVDHSFDFPADEYGCCVFEAGTDGQTLLYAKQIYVKKDNWAYIITATCTSEEDVNMLLSCFSAIDDFETAIDNLRSEGNTDLNAVLDQLQEAIDSLRGSSAN